MTRFTLYSRSYCHLCDDMLEALQHLRAEFEFTVDIVDVDAEPALLEKYNELVPVLAGHRGPGEAVQLCHYFLDAAAVREFLSGAAPERR